MSDIELRDELTTLLVAGHETTATALAWVRWTLGTPGLAARLNPVIRPASTPPAFSGKSSRPRSSSRSTAA